MVKSNSVYRTRIERVTLWVDGVMLDRDDPNNERDCQCVTCPFCQLVNIITYRGPNIQACKHFMTGWDANEHGVCQSFLFTDGDPEEERRIFEEREMFVLSTLGQIGEAVYALRKNVPCGVTNIDAQLWNDSLDLIEGQLLPLDNILSRRTSFNRVIED